MLKCLMLLCGILSFLGSISAQNYSGEWNSSDTLPFASVYAASTWLGDTLYVHTPTGNSGLPSDLIFKYTPGGTWIPGVSLPDTLTGGVLTSCGSKLFYVGGSPAGVNYPGSTLYEYNPAQGEWIERDTLPEPVSGHTALSWGDSIIYVIGGPWTGSKDNRNVHYYRLLTGKWETITNSIPAGEGRRTFASGISGNKIIISCGFNTEYLNSTLIGTAGSNASELTWEMGPDLPVDYSLSRPGGTAYNDLFFLIGGEKSGGFGITDSSHVYSISLGVWFEVITGKPVRTSNIFNSVTSKVINDTVRIFVTGGYNGSAVNAFDILGSGSITIPVNGIENEQMPDGFVLYQNYPNPFNPSTSISYSIPTASYVTLKVYDVIGNEAVILVNEEQSAGRHSVLFDASAFSSGVYFYTITAGEIKATKKLLLLK